MSIDLGPRLGGGDLDTLRHVLSLDLKGEAAEFGVATGTTLALIAQHMFVTGFDSFDGLPEDWRAGQRRSIERGSMELALPPD